MVRPPTQSAGLPGPPTLAAVETIRMSQVMSPPALSDQERLEKLCTAIRGKMQFMDYLVRAAMADVERYRDETDPGTRIFIRQLVEMHVTNLSAESDHMT